MKLTQIVSTQDSELLDIRWDPNNICNFKCHYCFPGSNAGNYRSPTDIDLVLDNFSHLLNISGKKKFKITISGGEPTMWKDLGYFIKKIKESHDVYISLITNGSRTLRWWNEYGDYIDNVHISYHLKEADLKHTIDVADTMFSKNKKTTVKILMDPELWQKGIDAVDTMKRDSQFPWFISVAKLVGDYQYSEEQMIYLNKDLKRIPGMFWFFKNLNLVLNGLIRRYESIAVMANGKKIKSKTYKYINSNLTNFKGWKCNLGIESVYISPSGQLGGACGQKLSGNILSKDFKRDVKLASVICDQLSCLCVPETHISKSRF